MGNDEQQIESGREQSLPAYFGPAARLLRGKSRAGVRNPLKRGVGLQARVTDDSV